MDKNDYLGSFAQENVSFQTQVVRTASVGDNYYRVMVFLEKSRFISDASAFVPVDGSDVFTAATVTAETFASVTSGLLQSWLTDLFANGYTGDVYLINLGVDDLADDVTDVTAFVEPMTQAYELLKAHAYWKVACAGSAGVSAAMGSINAALADLCLADKDLLSGPVCLPYSTATPETPASDVLYDKVKDKYVFMACHADATKNAALYSLGLALSYINGSGTPIGNSLDMVKSSNITASGPSGTTLARSVRDALNALNIQTFKPVGNNTGDVAAEGDQALDGTVIGAQWITCYVAYMTKVRVAEAMTTVNYYKVAANYTNILAILQSNIMLFGSTGSGRLAGIAITAPSFDSLPDSDADELIVPHAWEATYISHLRKVRITGTLYLEV